MPSSRRGTAVCRIAGLNAAANRNVMPASVARAATRSGGRSSRTPSASRTSADPDCEDADRLPCLTTRAPAPAATIAAIVEMLTDIDRSAPGADDVEQPALARRSAWPARPSRRPVPPTSSTVSPLARSETAKPAIWAGVASPARISPIAHAVWALVRSVRATSAPRTSGQVDMAESGQAVAGVRARSSATTVSASWIGSIGCGTAPSARDQVASQASCGRPVSTSSGGQR